ncbi:MAG: DNA/RNA nuclease SfsA [Clostridiales bacterium]|nr:DNA/RNA nuclease SfsA [Clostridiales bacterium]
MILYHHLTRCRFLYRVNRFIAVCDVGGEITGVHVKNTGRLGELLLPGAPVYLEHSGNPLRKTAYDLVAVENRGYVVNIDSQAPNAVVREWIEGGGLGADVSGLRAEVVSGDSRYDFAYVRGDVPGLVEVKGVTLFDDEGVAFFPDAPTERGVKHLRGLTGAARNGTECSVCFVLQRDDVLALRPNDATHPAFGDALREAAASGVRLFACVCHVEPDRMQITHTVPVIL